MLIPNLNVVPVVIAILLATTSCYAQSPVPNQPNILIERLMTPDIFKSSGLTKLSPSELLVLDRWLSSAIPIISSSMASATPAAPGGVIESYIDGDFHGWDGETVYKLQNGQIWQQLTYHYHYHYAYGPKVLIYPSGGGYKMNVEGDDDEPISVRRLK